MGRERAFFENHPAQPPFVIFEQFGWPQIARNQDRVSFQTKLRRSAHLAGHDAEQSVGKIL